MHIIAVNEHFTGRRSEFVRGVTRRAEELTARLQRKEWVVHGHEKGAEKLERLCRP